MAEKQMELELDWQTALLALKHHIIATKVRMDRLEKMFREAPGVKTPNKARRIFSGILDATVAMNFGIKLTVVEVHGGPWDYVLRDFNDCVLEFGAAYMIVGRHSDGHREIVNIAMLRRADYKIVVNIHLDTPKCFAALFYKGGKMFETELKEVRDAPGSIDSEEPLKKP
jgi:hypothetical protein